MIMSWNGMVIGRAHGGSEREDVDYMLDEAYEKGREDMRREMMDGGRYGDRSDYPLRRSPRSQGYRAVCR